MGRRTYLQRGYQTHFITFSDIDTTKGFIPDQKIDSGLPACSWTVVFYLVGELHVQAMINLVSKFRISWAVQLHSNRILILIMFLYDNRSGMHVQISADLMSYLF